MINQERRSQIKPMENMPRIRMGIVGVSRDCFPIELARGRLKRVLAECNKLKLDTVECNTIIETEHDAMTAVEELTAKHVNAASIYLGNFGPEGPLTILAEKLHVPFMLVAAAEESRKLLFQGRGDAFCGMLNACFNAGLRHLIPYVPAEPVGLPKAIARNVAHFIDVARVVIGLKNLKVLSFGPRPQDFYACNAPIKPLYDLGVEIMENSELDMFELFKSVEGRRQDINFIANDMAKELGRGNKHPEKLKQIAQFELALMLFFEKNLGSRHFGVYANKCWPTFEKAFGFVPCYVNSRFAARGIPVACEADIYGAVSEYIVQLASHSPVTLLDVNNTVPDDLKIANLKGASRKDLFMGFHCGNTPIGHLCKGFCMKYQVIMNRLMEKPGVKPDITCGTLEGTLKPGPATIFRLQPKLDNNCLMSYLAEGDVLDANPSSFGGIGIIGIPHFARFYRHVLLEKQFPHHAAMAFNHVGKVTFDAVRLLGVDDIQAPRPDGWLYPGENPF